MHWIFSQNVLLTGCETSWSHASFCLALHDDASHIYLSNIIWLCCNVLFLISYLQFRCHVLLYGSVLCVTQLVQIEMRWNLMNAQIYHSFIFPATLYLCAHLMVLNVCVNGLSDTSCFAAVWNQETSRRFRFVWINATTFEPYVLESSLEPLKSSASNALSSLKHVFCSLTPNARKIFLLIARHQLDNAESPLYSGTLTFANWTCNECCINWELQVYMASS